MPLELIRHDLKQLLLDLERRAAGREPGAIANPEDVGVDRNGRLAERDVEHHVGGLAAHARQRFERLARGRHHAAILIDQPPRERDHVLGLGTKETNGLDVVGHLGFAERHHLGGCIGRRKQSRRCLVDTRVRCLRGEHDGDQQRIGIDMLELALGLGPRGAEAPERLGDLGRRPRRGRRLCAGDLGPQNMGGRLDRARWLAAGRHFFSRSCRCLSRCFPGHAFPILAGMVPDNDPAQEPAIFSAVLTPHRSLSRKGFLVFMLVLGSLSLTSGLYFLSAGAWPVFGFLGLDVLLVYWAFRVNYRSARAYEVVTVTPSELTIRKVSYHGRVRQWRLNPVWVRLDRDEHKEFGIERLFLVSHGRRLPIAGFLGAREKASFALALAGALAEAKRGPTRTVFAPET